MNVADLKVGDIYSLHDMPCLYTGYLNRQFFFTRITPRGAVDIILGESQIKRELK